MKYDIFITAPSHLTLKNIHRIYNLKFYLVFFYTNIDSVPENVLGVDVQKEPLPTTLPESGLDFINPVPYQTLTLSNKTLHEHI